MGTHPLGKVVRVRMGQHRAVLDPRSDRGAVERAHVAIRPFEDYRTGPHRSIVVLDPGAADPQAQVLIRAAAGVALVAGCLSSHNRAHRLLGRIERAHDLARAGTVLRRVDRELAIGEAVAGGGLGTDAGRAGKHHEAEDTAQGRHLDQYRPWFRLTLTAYICL